uniref:Uncharacterized protein n=1 Tax=Romanomermis culicivorax TaxID=13658 RepID=A0A915IMT4_ROMCU
MVTVIGHHLQIGQQSKETTSIGFPRVGSPFNQILAHRRNFFVQSDRIR